MIIEQKISISKWKVLITQWREWHLIWMGRLPWHWNDPDNRMMTTTQIPRKRTHRYRGTTLSTLHISFSEAQNTIPNTSTCESEDDLESTSCVPRPARACVLISVSRCFPLWYLCLCWPSCQRMMDDSNTLLHHKRSDTNVDKRPVSMHLPSLCWNSCWRWRNSEPTAAVLYIYDLKSQVKVWCETNADQRLHDKAMV